MPTSEDLVPNDLPHGSRQEVVAGMQQAGVPTSSSPASPASVPPPSVAPSSAPRQRVAGFDALANRTPATPFGAVDPALPPPDPLAALRESPNAIIREIADLMPDYLQGG